MIKHDVIKSCMLGDPFQYKTDCSLIYKKEQFGLLSRNATVSSMGLNIKISCSDPVVRGNDV